MTISENKIVTLTYKLSLSSNGNEVVETIRKEKPLVFLFGAGNMLPEFEENLVNKSQGDPFSFILKSDEAYGDIREEAVVDVPLNSFKIDGKIDESMLQVGKSIPMRDQHGNGMNGVVTALDNEYVTMDFNHPLAGRDLHFEGQILEVRDAPGEELLNHLHPHSGGCGDTCQDRSCGDDCGCGSDDSSHNYGDNGCGCNH